MANYFSPFGAGGLGTAGGANAFIPWSNPDRRTTVPRVGMGGGGNMPVQAGPLRRAMSGVQGIADQATQNLFPPTPGLAPMAQHRPGSTRTPGLGSGYTSYNPNVPGIMGAIGNASPFYDPGIFGAADPDLFQRIQNAKNLAPLERRYGTSDPREMIERMRESSDPSVGYDERLQEDQDFLDRVERNSELSLGAQFPGMRHAEAISAGAPQPYMVDQWNAEVADRVNQMVANTPENIRRREMDAYSKRMGDFVASNPGVSLGEFRAYGGPGVGLQGRGVSLPESGTRIYRTPTGGWSVRGSGVPAPNPVPARAAPGAEPDVGGFPSMPRPDAMFSVPQEGIPVKKDYTDYYNPLHAFGAMKAPGDALQSPVSDGPEPVPQPTGRGVPLDRNLSPDWMKNLEPLFPPPGDVFMGPPPENMDTMTGESVTPTSPPRVADPDEIRRGKRAAMGDLRASVIRNDIRRLGLSPVDQDGTTASLALQRYISGQPAPEGGYDPRIVDLGERIKAFNNRKGENFFDSGVIQNITQNYDPYTSGWKTRAQASRLRPGPVNAIRSAPHYARAAMLRKMLSDPELYSMAFRPELVQ